MGDGDYGSRQVNRAWREKHDLKRLFLHAAELEIPHPRDGNARTFTARLPEDLQMVLDALKPAR